MKNKISDLRDHMFAALERLGEEDISPEKLKQEIDKARAISEIGKVIVESAKTELLHAKLTRKQNDAGKFLEIDDAPKIPVVRPEAKYSNPDFGQTG